MRVFTAWRIGTPEGAENLLGAVRALADRGVIQIDDAAIVSWPEGRNMPTTRDLGSLTGPGLLWSGFWGMMFGVIFLVPAGGLAFGASAGAIAGSLSDFGIGERFIVDLRDSIVPGSSALVALSEGESVDRMVKALDRDELELVRSELTPQQEARLRRALVEGPAGETP